MSQDLTDTEIKHIEPTTAEIEKFQAASYVAMAKIDAMATIFPDIKNAIADHTIILAQLSRTLDQMRESNEVLCQSNQQIATALSSERQSFIEAALLKNHVPMETHDKFVKQLHITYVSIITALITVIGTFLGIFLKTQGSIG